MRSRIFALVAASLLTFSLAACYAVPDAGPVREGLSHLTQAERGVFLDPQGPTRGADQESIVRGFIRAAGSNTNNYKIAREFLAPTYADKWDPRLGAVINDGVQQYQSPEDGIGVLSLHAVARIDSGGTMSAADPDVLEEMRFEFTEVNGEWRISSAPNGVIIDRSTFSTVWSTKQIYFLRPDQKLVPEVRWFLTGDQLMPTQIVRALMVGPSPLMTGAVRTAFPQGTKLTIPDVPVVDGVAVINCSNELLDADDTMIAALNRQLAVSLQSQPGVKRFQLVVRGAVIGGGEVALSEEVPSGQYQSIAVLKEDQFGIASGGLLDPMHGISEQVVGLAPKAATMSPDLTSVAVLHGGGVNLVTKDRSLPVDRRERLLAPSLDASGYVWSYSLDDPDQVQVSTGEIRALTLQAPWLAGETVKAIRVSMGGNRIAALVSGDAPNSASGSTVLVAGIVRSDAGAPIGFTNQASVQMRDTGAPIDLDWISDSRYVLLSSTGLLGGTAKVTIGEVGGRFPVDSGTVAGGVEISGGGSSRALMRVLDDQGRMLAPQGSGWQQLMSGVELIAKVG